MNSGKQKPHLVAAQSTIRQAHRTHPKKQNVSVAYRGIFRPHLARLKYALSDKDGIDMTLNRSLSLLIALTAIGCGSEDDANPTDDTQEIVLDIDDDGYGDDEDCDDNNADIYPDAVEIPNDGIDQDCDGLEVCPADNDGDGYGTDDGTTATSEALDCVGEGVSDNSLDCNDTDETFYPSAPEDDCTDPNDYNCDGSTGYADADMDGFAACEDCDDGNPTFNPDASEIPGDEIDQDCDKQEICFADLDNDGYRPDETTTVNSADVDCADMGEAVLDDPIGDCNDDDDQSYPDAPEIWYDGVNQDCGDTNDFDQDGDGFNSDKHSGDDCNDTDEFIYPDAPEIRQNGIDEDCDGFDAAFTISDLSAGDLMITEVMRNPSATNDDVGEWFEILNNSGGALDLDGLHIYDKGSQSFNVSGSLTVAKDAYVTFGPEGDSTKNGGVTIDYDYSISSMTLGNADDELYLAESSSKKTIFDSLEWNDTYFPDIEGTSGSLDSRFDAADENDHLGNWCNATSTYGSGDEGTPGAVNDNCNFTYTWGDVSLILTSNCSTCHTSGSSAGLTSIGTWSNVVWQLSTQDPDYLRVDPFSTADSYLWQKISGTASSGVKMPKGRTLSSTNISIIKTWIEDGAPQ